MPLASTALSRRWNRSSLLPFSRAASRSPAPRRFFLPTLPARPSCPPLPKPSAVGSWPPPLPSPVPARHAAPSHRVCPDQFPAPEQSCPAHGVLNSPFLAPILMLTERQRQRKASNSSKHQFPVRQRSGQQQADSGLRQRSRHKRFQQRGKGKMVSSCATVGRISK
ncbi:unnamed protein product [Urochloa humidicola]